MAYRSVTRREAGVLRTLPAAFLPHYVRTLNADGVRYRDIAAVLGVSESRVADIAAAGRPPVCGQELPAGFAGYLRQLRDERDPNLNATIAAAIAGGWTRAALAAALGISPQAVATRAARATNTAPADEYIPVPAR